MAKQQVIGAFPTAMAQNRLNPEKGWPFGQPLDFTASISTTVLYSMRRGQVAQRDSSTGNIVPGVSGYGMGLFLFGGANDLDVDPAGGAPTFTSGGQSVGYWTSFSPSGVVGLFVARGNYELGTTEYDTAQTYLYDQPLRAPMGLTAGDEYVSGMLTNQGVTPAAGANAAVCAVVSRGVRPSPYGGNNLVFWPVWFPAHVHA